MTDQEIKQMAEAVLKISEIFLEQGKRHLGKALSEVSEEVKQLETVTGELRTEIDKILKKDS